MYYTYILQSEIDQSYYIGYTSNLERRFAEHNGGLSRYTRTKMPWKLVFYESHETKSSAIRRENWLKAQRNSRFYEELIKTLKVG